jgi:hypothetical protein
MSKAVGVLIDGVVEWHAPGVAGPDYDTLCGIDANDPTIGHHGLVPAKRGQKITCMNCKMIWEGVVALNLRMASFA